MTKKNSKKSCKAQLSWLDKLAASFHWIIIGCASCTVLLFAFHVSANLNKPPLITNFDIKDDFYLRDVFFGGEPWLILCSDSKNAHHINGTLRETFVETAKLLNDQDFAGNTFTTKSGIVDCTRLLPSGKSIYERLNLDAKLAPVVFLSVGGDKPKQLEPSMLKRKTGKMKQKSGKSEKYDVDLFRPLALAIKQRLQKRYEILNVEDSVSLNSKCTERKFCALVIGSEPLSKSTKSILDSVSRNMPMVRWAYIDVGDAGFELNVLDEITNGVSDIKPDFSSIVLFKKKQFKTMKGRQTLSQLDKRSIVKFLQKASADGMKEGFNSLKKGPKVKRKSKVSKKANSRHKKKQAKEAESSNSSPNKMESEEEKLRQLEHEKQRRAEIDRERMKFVPQFNDEDDDSFIVFEDLDHDDIDEIVL